MNSKSPGHDGEKSIQKQRSQQPGSAGLANDHEQQQAAISFQQARLDPRSLTPRKILHLQRTVGNRVVGQLINRGLKPGTIQRGRRKNKGKVISGSNAELYITTAFAEKHMGSEDDAVAIAEKRFYERIPFSHVVARSEMKNLIAEIKDREANTYHIPNNQKPNTKNNNNMQYLTDKTYDIYEVKYTNKGKAKKPKVVQKKFFYDVILNPTNNINAIHHFDGVQ